MDHSHPNPAREHLSAGNQTRIADGRTKGVSVLVLWLSLCLFLPSSKAAILVVTNQADAGPGSMRQAMVEANATPSTNAILFALPGPGPFSIQPVSPLPAILQPLLLNAASKVGVTSRHLTFASEFNCQNLRCDPTAGPFEGGKVSIGKPIRKQTYL